MTSPVDQFAKRAREALAGAPAPADMEKNLRALAASALQKMDVVSREEFDAQSAVLARTRARLEALEQRLEALQAELDGHRGPGAETDA